MYLIFESPLHEQVNKSFLNSYISEVEQPSGEEVPAPEEADPLTKQLSQIINPLSKEETNKIQQIKDTVTNAPPEDDEELPPDEMGEEIPPEEQMMDDEIDRLEMKNEALKIYYLYKDLVMLRNALDKNSYNIEDKEQLDNTLYFIDFIIDFYSIFDYNTITNIILSIQKQVSRLK